MATNKLQWKRIAKGDKLPCQSFLRKKNGEILKLSTGAGVKVGQDAYYLPVDDVIEEIKNYPIEESEDEKMRRELVERFSHIKGFDWYGLPIKDILAWLEKQGEPKEINPSEFDSQLNRLLGQFKSLPKKELASSLSFYLNVVQNDGTYKEEKQGEQKRAEWSEEDESKRNLCFKYLTAQKNYQSAIGIDYINGCLDWLDSIKERVLPQPKQEWNKKKDEENSKNILYILNQLKGNTIYSEDKIAENCIDWLKSLKDRYTWKPSDEQMTQLFLVANQNIGNILGNKLMSLYNDLTKLTK